jgi:hypothetical protein
LETETANENDSRANGESKGARKTRQAQIPGTEHKASKTLRTMHDDYAAAKYDQKTAANRMSELAPQIIERMQQEKCPALSSEVEYEGDVRLCITELDPGRAKLKSKLKGSDEDDE